ncbi:MAG: TlpA family protein disulfide reductase [Planctomycetota bacterium]
MRSHRRGVGAWRRIAAALGLMIAGCASLNRAADAGQPAPEFTLQDTYGQPVSLKAYRGAVLFISFGATW